MFVPVSLAIADEIRWVLEKCYSNPWLPLTGEKNRNTAGCATSMEDLVKLPSSLLGTRHVQAFSANMPVEAAAVSEEPRRRYAITALHRIVPTGSSGDGESSEMVTCHDMTYPYVVFYCHMAGPATRAYMVVLWSPKHPFLQEQHAKPGDVEACHFLPKSSIVWVPSWSKENAVL
ncbi:BURP domain-containing protein 11-like [Oryza sativa Japonica Group]|uniref:BURP domain-containing protein 11-like n=1 Tax=Oryza sativa subsp. japonica TaxID=39947 RepID=UPI00339BD204